MSLGRVIPPFRIRADPKPHYCRACVRRSANGNTLSRPRRVLRRDEALGLHDDSLSWRAVARDAARSSGLHGRRLLHIGNRIAGSACSQR